MAKNLNILWWNVRFTKFARTNGYVIKTLEKFGPFDVICLQEYVEGGKSDLKHWLQERNYTIEYLPFASQGKYSQGIMTAVQRELPANQNAHVLRRDEPIRRRPFPNIRGMISTTISRDDESLHVMNFHSTYPRKHTRDMRHREFQSLKAILENDFHDKKWILGGDFNFVGRDERRHYFTKTYNFATGTTLKKTFRWGADFSPIAANVDYIVWNNLNTEPQLSLAPFSGSDHRPLLVSVHSREFTSDS